MAELNDEIEKYSKGELTPAEMHQLERKALNDPFLSDALEGIHHAGVEIFSEDIAFIHEELFKKKRKALWFTPFRMAASLIILIAASAALYITVLKDDDSAEQLAKIEKQPGKTTSPAASQTDSTGNTVPEKKKELLTYQSSKPKGTISGPHADVPAATRHLVQQESESPVADRSEVQTPVQKDSVTRNEIAMAPEEKKLSSPAAPSASHAAVNAGDESFSQAKSSERAKEARDVKQSKIRGRVSVAGNSSAPTRVAVKGTSIETQTDKNGNYEILAKDDKAGQSLVFSSAGFQTTEVDADNLSVVDVQLSKSSGKPAEVVVGYISDEKSDRDDPTALWPKPVNGSQAYNNYLETNLHYPIEAIKLKIQGKVLITFSVKADGSLTDFQTIQTPGYGCDDELIRLVKQGPSWQPLLRAGKSYNSKVFIRYEFVLPK